MIVFGKLRRLPVFSKHGTFTSFDLKIHRPIGIRDKVAKGGGGGGGNLPYQI